jgi:transposase
MPMQRVEVITSVKRRWRWSLAEKERLVAASLEPGVSVSEVALVPVTIMPTPTVVEPSPPPCRRRRRSGMTEIEVSGGCRVRVGVGGDVDAEALRRVLDVLEER